MRPTEFELSAVDVAQALGALVTDSTIRNWYHAGHLPAAYVWRSPSGRLFFKRKVVSWLLAGGTTLAQPTAPPKSVKRPKPIVWDGAA